MTMEHQIAGTSNAFAASLSAGDTENTNKYANWFHKKIDLFFEKYSKLDWTAWIDLTVFGGELNFRLALTDEGDLFEYVKTGRFTETNENSESVVSLLVTRHITAQITNFTDDLEALLSLNDEFEHHIEWSVPNVHFHFSLVRLRFYSADAKLAFTKYLHLEQDTPDCGCDLEYPFNDRICSDYEMGCEYHFMNLNTNFDAFCTSKEMQSLSKERIHVVADFTFGQERAGTDSESSMRAEGEGKSLTVHTRSRRQEMLKDITADVIFRLASGETVMAHKKVLLEGRSEMLKSMMEADMREAKSREIRVTDETFTPLIFQDFLNGLYGDWNERDCENCKVLFSRFKILDYYLAPDLLDVNIGTIIGSPHSAFSTHTALEMYEIGCIYNIQCLKNRCLQWLNYKKEIWSDEKGLLDALKTDVEDLALALTLENPLNATPLMNFLKCC